MREETRRPSRRTGIGDEPGSVYGGTLFELHLFANVCDCLRVCTYFCRGKRHSVYVMHRQVSQATCVCVCVCVRVYGRARTPKAETALRNAMCSNSESDRSAALAAQAKCHSSIGHIHFAGACLCGRGGEQTKQEGGWRDQTGVCSEGRL